MAQEKLKNLREIMHESGIHAYLQPVHDEWMSEYPPTCNRRVEWLTSFSGSAGLAVVTLSKAAFFTDGRYTLQARAQLPEEYEVYNSVDQSPEQWLTENLQAGSKIGYDPKLYTKPMLQRFEATLAGRQISLVPVANLIDQIWENRPPAPATPIFIHDIKYSGETLENKISRIAGTIKKSGADAAFLNSPESVNWLLNIRARDTENTPLCLVRAIISTDGIVHLFVDKNRISPEVAAHFGNLVTYHTPEDLETQLKKFADKIILIDKQNTPVFVKDLCRDAGIILQAGTDPCTLPQAIKNEVELSGMRRAHIRDGASIARLLCWLAGQENISELEVTEKLLNLRAENELFVEPSFDTIAGSGAHGAIVHYRATEESNRILQRGELFLLDSGGQYYDGTTDITRTIAIGTPSAEQKQRFTIVLKGHIALADAKFPEGTTGSQLDALARQYLWQHGLDYDHGTGHGVGCFLGVHEGPQRISKRADSTPLAAGMILSNEPGYYKEGEYGIRIENLIAVVENGAGESGKKFFNFETLTCAPIDIRLVDNSLLTQKEKVWLNEYHAWVMQQLKPLLDTNEQQWLEKACAPIHCCLSG